MIEHCPRCGTTGTILTTDFRTRVPCDAPGCPAVKRTEDPSHALIVEAIAEMREMSASVQKSKDALNGLRAEVAALALDRKEPSPPAEVERKPVQLLTKLVQPLPRDYVGLELISILISISSDPYAIEVRSPVRNAYFEAHWLWLAPATPRVRVCKVVSLQYPQIGEGTQVGGEAFERWTLDLPNRPLVGRECMREALDVVLEMKPDCPPLTLYVGGRYVDDVVSIHEGRRNLKLVNNARVGGNGGDCMIHSAKVTCGNGGSFR